MSNLGLGNLIELKRNLLSPDLVPQTKYDARITAIGQGVAKWFDKHCNRKFENAAATTDTFHSQRRVWILERYPVVTITAVDERTSLADGWVSLGTVNNALQNWDANSGTVYLSSLGGSHLSETRITYSGGYYFDVTETDPPGTTPPAGQTLLPTDVKGAWFLQCKKLWETYDVLGGGIVSGGSGAQLLGLSLAGLDILPAVEAMLQGHIRMNVS
jgi:hypothetical protein